MSETRRRQWPKRGLFALAAVGFGLAAANLSAGKSMEASLTVLLFVLAVVSGIAKTGTA